MNLTNDDLLSNIPFNTLEKKFLNKKVFIATPEYVSSEGVLNYQNRVGILTEVANHDKRKEIWLDIDGRCTFTVEYEYLKDTILKLI